MVHEDSSYDFKDTGVILVTGANGRGKSSIVEGVCCALWNKSIRGTKPWVAGKKGFVELTTNIVYVKRTSKKLEWNLVGEEPTSWESQTHSQDALEKVVGTFDVWQRTAIFSGQDSSHFTTATDSQRKKLLETILGLERLERAHVLARKAYKEEQQANAVLKTELERHTYQLESKIEKLKIFKDLVDDCPTEPDLTGLPELRSRKTDLEGDIRVKRKLSRDIDNRQFAIKNEYKLKVTDSSLLLKGTCPTCQTEFDPNTVQDVKGSLHKAKGIAQAALSALDIEKQAVDADIGVLEVAYVSINSDMAGLDSQLRSYEASKTKLLRYASEKTSVEVEIADLTAQLTATKALLLTSDQQVAVLASVDQLLGTKGVRSYILSKTLGGIEGLANAWLSRICGKAVRVKLSPYKEKKTGGTTDSISLDIEGVGGGFGYKGTSGGERRRIDIALLLALSEISSNIEGNSFMLAFDEVFDTLDEEGISSLVDIINEIATNKQVLVISHSQFLVKVLKTDQQIHLD